MYQSATLHRRGRISRQGLAARQSSHPTRVLRIVNTVHVHSVLGPCPAPTATIDTRGERWSVGDSLLTSRTHVSKVKIGLL